ncbi:MAG: cytochrome c biogenesis protein CcsA [Actinomycetia bacterium]|nr:cytochrome c biogenesis protein CcsA [Actinomycetes bacterium]MCP4960732.1 cytochrome c biogenesis protein CcsA [Actinomycetes bacterium]
MPVSPRTSARMATSSVGTTVLGWLAFVSLVATAVLGLVVSPRDVVTGDAVRFLYLHVPVIWVAYGAFISCAIASALFLWKGKSRADRGRHLDRVAGASAEVGVVFTALALITGAMWGRITWGVYWQWDARLTMTAMMFVSFLGYLALRRLPTEPSVRSKRAAIAALVSSVNLPLVHFSVDWWRTLHQEASLSVDEAEITGNMYSVLLFSSVAFVLTGIWLVAHRYRVIRLEEIRDDEGLELAIAARRAEAGVD